MDNRTNDIIPGLLDFQELKTLTPKITRTNPVFAFLGEMVDPPPLNVGADLDREAAYAAQDRMNDEGPIFYHGTNIPGITQFKATKTDDDFIPGVSLTPDFESAQIYADEMVERHGGSPIVYEVKIKKGSGPVANLFDVLEQIDPKQQGEFQDEDIIKFLQEGSYIGLDDSGYLSPDPSIRIIDPSLLEIQGPDLTQPINTQEPIAYRTSDGYTFFLQEDGNLTDNVDPEKSDMMFDSIEQIEEEMGEPLLPLGPDANELNRFKQSQWMQGWLNFREGPLSETEKYIRALNKQRRAKSRADLRLSD